MERQYTDSNEEEERSPSASLPPLPDAQELELPPTPVSSTHSNTNQDEEDFDENEEEEYIEEEEEEEESEEPSSAMNQNNQGGEEEEEYDGEYEEDEEYEEEEYNEEEEEKLPPVPSSASSVATHSPSLPPSEQDSSPHAPQHNEEEQQREESDLHDEEVLVDSTSPPRLDFTPPPPPASSTPPTEEDSASPEGEPEHEEQREEEVVFVPNEAQKRAAEALEGFHAALKGKLIESAIDDATNVAAHVLADVIDAYEKDVAELKAQRATLDAELQQNKEAMQAMAGELTKEVKAHVARVYNLEGVSSSSSSSLAIGASEMKERGEGGAPEEAIAEDERNLDRLFTAYVKSKSMVKLLETERDQTQGNLAALRLSLLDVTKENMSLRHQVELLRATSVPIDLHRAAVVAKEEAEHQCTLLKLQMAKAGEELELLELERERLDQMQHALPSSQAPLLDAAQRLPTAPGPESEQDIGEGATATRSGPVWDAAIRELEAKAASLVHAKQLEEDLAASQARVKALEEENQELEKFNVMVRNEVAEMASDLESLYFRNTVLSQQLVSLLVQEENMRRCMRKTSAQELPAAVASSEKPVAQLTHQPSSVSSLSAPFTASSVFASPPRASLDASHAATQRSFQQTLAAGSVGRPLDPSAVHQDSLRRGMGTGQLVQASPLSPNFSTVSVSALEAREGLTQRLQTYSQSGAMATATSPASSIAARARRVPLRRLGVTDLSVDLPCAPRIPACDQLSGVALGRSSVQAIVDPISGAVQRVHAKPYVARAMEREVQVPKEAYRAATDSGSEAVRLGDVLDAAGNRDDLGAFCVNSVQDLVSRNQQLLEQLYAATQDAQKARDETKQLQQRCRLAGLNSEEEEAGHFAALLDGEAKRAHGYPAPPPLKQQRTESALPQTLTESADALLSTLRARLSTSKTTVVEANARDSVTQPSRGGSMKRARDAAPGDGVQPMHGAPATPSGLVHTPQASAHEKPSFESAEVEKEREEASSVVSDGASTATQEGLRQVVAAMVQAHETRIASADASLSLQLVDSLAAWQNTLRKRDEKKQQSGEEDSASGVEQLLGWVLKYCVEQSSVMAQQAVVMAGQKEVEREAVQKTWSQMSDALMLGLERYHALLQTHARLEGQSVSSATSTSELAVPTTDRYARENGLERLRGPRAEGDDEGMAPHSRLRDSSSSFDEKMSLMESLRDLLSTAAQKDTTLMRIYHSAQARQEAHQTQQRELLAKKVLKQQRLQRLCLEGAGGTRGSVAGSPLPASTGRLGSPPPAMQLPESGELGSSPQRRGSPLAGRDEALADHAPMPPADDLLYDEDEIVELEVFHQLRDQLHTEQERYRNAMEQLSAEKQKHTAMYERMWKLETERDEAVQAAQKADEEMGAMMSREEFEAVVAELDQLKATLDDRDAQLRDAHGECNGLQTRLDILQDNLDHHQQYFDSMHVSLQEKLNDRERQLIQRDMKENVLINERDRARVEQEKAHTALERANEEVRCLKCRVAELTEEGVALKALGLSADHVQAFLQRWYPNDSALQANALLVQSLTKKLRAVEEEARESESALHEADLKREEDQSRLRQAIQERQAAETRMQEAMAELATLRRLREAEGGVPQPVDGTGPASQDEEEQQQPHKKDHEEEEEEDEARFIMETASVIALRRRVRQLTTKVEGLQSHLTVLKDAQAAWQLREGELRRQLDLLSTDPVSYNARKYGLTACTTFTEQIAEMAARETEIQTRLTAKEAECAALQGSLDGFREEAAAAKTSQATAESTLSAVQRELSGLQEAEAQLKDSIAKVEADLQSKAEALDSTSSQLRNTESAKQTAEGQLQRTVSALQRCETQRNQFLSDNNKLISKIQELEQALLQADAEKRAAREALSQGLSSATRRRGGRGATTAGGPPRSNASLTQDLSFSPFSSK